MLVCNSQRIYPVLLPSPPRRSRSGLAALRHLQKDLYSLLGTLTSEPLYCMLTFFDSALMNMFYITSVPLSDWLTCDPTSTTVMLVLKVISGMSFLWLPLYCKLQALLFALLVLENNICGFCGVFFFLQFKNPMTVHQSLWHSKASDNITHTQKPKLHLSICCSFISL